MAENAPYPFVDLDGDTDKPHIGGYRADAKVIIKSQRSFYLPTVTATVTRRIVRKFPYRGEIARQPIHSFPVQMGVGIKPGLHVISFTPVQLPGKEILPPGKYAIETFVQFSYNGNLITYDSETQELEITP